MEENSNCEDRLEKIKSLHEYLEKVDDRVNLIVKELDWDYNKILNSKDSFKLINCPIDPGHHVSDSKLEEHQARCQWRKEGYLDDDLPLPEFSGSGSHITVTSELQSAIINRASKAINGFKIGENSNSRLVPQTSNRFEQEFTRDERLAIYDYVVAHTQNQSSFQDLPFMDLEEKKEKKAMTLLELAAAERDAKRRRASYRNKVHTKCKTQTEVLRQVIESQMDCLVEEIEKDKKCDKEKEKEREKEKKKERERKQEESFNLYNREERDNFRYRNSKMERNDRKYESEYRRQSEEGRHHKKKKKEKHKKKHKDEKSRHKKKSDRDRSHSRTKSKKRKRSTSRSRSHDKNEK